MFMNLQIYVDWDFVYILKDRTIFLGRLKKIGIVYCLDIFWKKCFLNQMIFFFILEIIFLSLSDFIYYSWHNDAGGRCEFGPPICHGQFLKDNCNHGSPSRYQIWLVPWAICLISGSREFFLDQIAVNKWRGKTI